MLPVLYSFRRCPYAMRARLAIVSAGLRCELREIQLRHKPQALLSASPKGTVPVLILPGGQVLDESLDIMLHALRWHDPDGWLNPDPGSLDQMLALIARNDQHFKPALDRCKYHERYPQQELAQAQQEAAQWFTDLNKQLTPTGHLFGQRPSLADMALLPFARQFAHIDQPTWQARPWPHVHAWLQRWLDSALFAHIMEKPPSWQEGTKGAVFGLGRSPPDPVGQSPGNPSRSSKKAA